MKKLLLFVVLLTQCYVSQAVTYYFSSVTGDDSRTPQQAQNPATPWRSLAKFNAYHRDMEPGDSILFKRGEVFNGTMTVKIRGAAGRTIYFGAYGTGANPLFSGFTTVTDWTLHSPGIYSAPLQATNPNIITLNGEAKSMGRYPNSGYLKYENHNGNTSITDTELPASPSWTGAEVVIRKFRFILDRHRVTSHTGGTLHYNTSTTFGNNSAFSPVKNNGYFIQNHLGTLDQFGEWYYDTTAKRLFVFFGNNTPGAYTVKASTQDVNITVSTAYFLAFENLDFEGANGKGLNLVNVSNSLVQDCHFYNQGGISLYGIDMNSVTVRNCTISNSFSNGLIFEHNSNNCTIDNLSVKNTNTIPGTGRSGNGVGTGILVSGEGNTITNNQVIHSGYNGIHFLGNHVRVERNYVDTFCTVKDDGGGIYTYTGPSNEKGIGRVIRNNVVLNAIGARAGTDAYSYEPFGKAAGIYLDEHANGLEISGNTVAHGDWAGIFLHYAHSNVIRENLFYNHRFQVYISQFSPDTRNLLMTDNQYIARQPGQLAFYYHTSAQDSPAALGRFNYNFYARPADDNITFRVDNYFTGGNGTVNLTLAQWKAAYGLDSLSQKSPLTFAANNNNNIRFEYNATAVTKTVSLEAAYLDITNKPYTGDLVLQPFQSVVLLKSTAVSRANQSLQFQPLQNKTDGDAPFTLQATASSGLPASFRILSGPATVTGNQVSMSNAGTVTVEASQGGNNSFFAAASVVHSFTVQPNPARPPAPMAAQSLSFGSLPYRTWGIPPFHLTATASSGLPVSYRVVSGPASITNRTVNLIGAGTVTIEATQAGNEWYKAATAVTRSFTVGKTSQTLTFPQPSNKTLGDEPFRLTASSTSQAPVFYAVIAGPATVAGDTVTLTGAGTVTIEAAQPGNELTNPAYPLRRSFTVAGTGSRAAQTISFTNIGAKTFGDAPFTPQATASSGLPVTFRVTAGPAVISNHSVSLTGAGTVTIEATQPGNASFEAAPPVLQTVTINKAMQGITFGPIADKNQTDAPFILQAMASSGLIVSFRIVSGPATLSGNTVSLTGSGTVTVEALQQGDDNYLPANAVTQTFTVREGSTTTKQNQTISFGSLSYKTFSSPPFQLVATASSGLPVSYRVITGPATVSGTTVTIIGVGSVIIEAAQAGDAAYLSASPVQRSFTVGKAGQTITFTAPTGKTYGEPPFSLQATASSGLPVVYRIVSGPATVSGNTVTLTGAGTVTVEATQPGNENFQAAYPPQRSFPVAPGNPTLVNGKDQIPAPHPLGRAAQLSIYPNPVQSQGVVQVMVPVTTTGHLAIFTSEGKLVALLGNHRFEKNQRVMVYLPVGNLKAGSYFIRLTTGATIISQPFQVL